MDTQFTLELESIIPFVKKLIKEYCYVRREYLNLGQMSMEIGIALTIGFRHMDAELEEEKLSSLDAIITWISDNVHEMVSGNIQRILMGIREEFIDNGTRTLDPRCDELDLKISDTIETYYCKTRGHFYFNE